MSDQTSRPTHIPGTTTPIEYSSGGWPIWAVGGEMIILAPHATTGAPMFINIIRGGEPFKGFVGIPAGHVNPDETTKQGAIRETLEEINVSLTEDQVYLSHVASKPGRDPNKPCPAIVYWSLVPNMLDVEAGDDAAAVRWSPLADHTEMEFGFDTADTMKEMIDNVALRAFHDIRLFVDIIAAEHSRETAVQFIYQLFQLSSIEELKNIDIIQVRVKVAHYLANGFVW